MCMFKIYDVQKISKFYIYLFLFSFLQCQTTKVNQVHEELIN